MINMKTAPVCTWLLCGWSCLAFLSCNQHQASEDWLEIPVDTLYDKIYGAWLGQIIGNIYGLPHECQYIDQPGPHTFPYGYGDNLDRLKEIDGAFSDDDTDIEFMYLLQMEKHGTEPTYHQLADAWRYHIRDKIWLANRAALAWMNQGYDPPMTGFKRYNPHWFQIDPQLVNEIWAVTAPGMLDYATQKSAWAARITNSDWGVEPTVFYGAMFAAAFERSDVNQLIDRATAALPEDFRFRATILAVKEIYREHPDDWEAGRAALARKFYEEEDESVRTIWNANLNAACGVLAMLYGQGDFQYTLDLCCAMGYDADNQAATISGILGTIQGASQLPGHLLIPIDHWTMPFNDLYKNVTRFDLPDIKLTELARLSQRQAEKLVLEKGGELIQGPEGKILRIPRKAQFVPPVSISTGLPPIWEVGEEVPYPLNDPKGPEVSWSLAEGELPQGLSLQAHQISGIPAETGTFTIKLMASPSDAQATQTFSFIIHEPNLAPRADTIYAACRKTDTAALHQMWRTIPSTHVAGELEAVIRDGISWGEQSTFYSVQGPGPKIDYYGYGWDSVQTIGHLAYYMGTIEENGGWFQGGIEIAYLDSSGEWVPVGEPQFSPDLIMSNNALHHPHYMRYHASFPPVTTKGIRIRGQAGGGAHWHPESRGFYFTSISELEVFSN